MEKMSLLCFESYCDMFMAAEVGGGGGVFHEDSTSFVYSDNLMIWVIITIRLLCLHFYENRFMEKGMKEHPENGYFNHFGPRVQVCSGQKYLVS